MKKTIFIKNAAILTASSLILRFAGIMFKVWLAAKIGAEGIGLYQLIFSVYVLISTFASVGICTAVTRLISEEAALGRKNGIKKILSRSVGLILIIAFVSLVVIFFGADFISLKFLSDPRAALSLKILGFSLPFMAVSSCFKGYFIALRNATPPATASIIEQAVRIILIILIINRIENLSVETACGSVLLGDTIAEAVSALYIFVLYLLSLRKLNNLTGRPRPPYPIVKQLIRISSPITLGRYLNSGLRTIENLLVPKTLAKYDASSSGLTQFGMIKGMALPLLFFPSALLNSISTLLIPEISEASVCGKKQSLKTSVERTINITLLVGIIFGSIFLVLGKKIGILIYKDTDVGFLISVLAPIVPLMYLDSICDGILKGLDAQMFCFRNSICDSSIRILLICLLLHKFGLNAFIGIMYFSNFLTCFLNVGKLLKLSQAKINILSGVLLPLVTALFTAVFFDFIIKFLNTQNLFHIIFVCALSGISYLLLLISFGAIKIPDFVKMYFKKK